MSSVPTPLRQASDDQAGAGAPGSGAVYDRMRRLAQAALVVLTGFLVSRVLGVIRNIVIAAQYGTGSQYEAYVAAIAVPDLVFQILVGGAVGSAFIPVFKQYSSQNRDEAWRLTSSAINLGFLVTASVAGLLAVFASPITDLALGAKPPEFRQLTADLMRILLVSPAIFAVSTFCASVLNSSHRFAVAALAPLMYNLSIIVAALALSGPLGIYGLALGAVAGAALHFLVQVPTLVRLGMRWRPIVDLQHPGLREVGRLFAPRMLGLAAIELNRVFSAVILASRLGTGPMAYLNYAWLMVMTPLTLAMAVGTAVFPTLSEDSALARQSQLRQVFLLSLRMILFLTIPASIGLMVLGEPVIALFFQRNQFGPSSTRGTAYALVFYAIGLAGHATVEIVDRVFYALHDTRTPVMVAVGAIGVNVLLSLVLMRTDLGYGGLALANSLAALLESLVLVKLISTRLRGLDVTQLTTSVLRILAASLVMGIPIAWAATRVQPLLAPFGTAGMALLVGGAAASGALMYVAASFCFGSEELVALRRLVRRERSGDPVGRS